MLLNISLHLFILELVMRLIHNKLMMTFEEELIIVVAEQIKGDNSIQIRWGRKGGKHATNSFTISFACTSV